MGRLAVTKSGFTCSSWQGQRSYRDAAFPEGSVKEAGSFCRNPRPNFDHPWCYYRARGGKTDRCNISACCEFIMTSFFFLGYY